MASKSTVAKMKHIEAMIKKYEAKRKQLKEEFQEKGEPETLMALAKLPRNSSKTRYRRLCKLTGRSRAVYRKFGISRIMLRELAHEGHIPGMKKASW